MSTFSTRSGLVAFAIVLMSFTTSTEAAKVPRSVLKEYFQSGDKPTQSQFASLIDSTVNFVDDRKLLGLKVYNPQLDYLPGDTAIFQRLAPGAMVGQIEQGTTGSPPAMEFGGLTGLSPNDPNSVDVATDFAGNYGFMGIKLETPTGEINYGYIQMSMDVASGLPNDPPAIHIDYIVYNDVVNEPLDVTAVPEPTSALAIGAVAMLMLRRKAR